MFLPPPLGEPVRDPHDAGRAAPTLLEELLARHVALQVPQQVPQRYLILSHLI